jgi:pimeloyl-ACP methyl ester carboxylesterase
VSRRGARATTLLLAALLLVVVGCTRDEEWRAGALGAEQLRGPGTFYDWDPTELDGAAGSLVRAERVLGAPEGTVGWRILFRSRDVHDDPVIVSGVVLAPDGDATDRPVVSWGHPTTGAAQQCAPSLGVDPFVTIEGATQLVDDGYVVVASDYPGMGARGPWSYLIGESEGRSVLDAARAVRELHGTDAGDRVVLWGHSQGGHAALFAARSARSYAPELDVRAVAVAAPAVELGQLLRDDISDSAGVALGSYAFWAYQRVYGAGPTGPRLDQILTPAGVGATPEMASLCLIGQHRALHRIADPLVGRYLSASPAEVEPWSTLLEQNTPTDEPYGLPVFVAQGGKDDLVKPATTAEYVARLCAAGQPVQFHRVPGASHLTIAMRSLPEVRAFFAAALDGRTPAETCS